MAPEPPKVFISYSHDSTKHAERVLELIGSIKEICGRAAVGPAGTASLSRRSRNARR